MENEGTTNRVGLFGRVGSQPELSHKIYGEAFYIFKLRIKRLSGVCDELPITFSERAAEPESIFEGCGVYVFGQLRSYNKLVNGVSRLILTVFAHEITRSDAEEKNEIYLRGFICKPPVYRTTPFEREIADLLIAVNRSYNKSDYIPCIAWGRNARFAQSLPVGACVELEGRVQSREYQKALPDGQVVTRVAYEVSAATISVCEREDL